MGVPPVAIVGIGCRFPGGVEDPAGFWGALVSGTDMIGDIPPDRWCADEFSDADADAGTPGRMPVRQGGFLRAPVDEFDAAFFGLTPGEAAALDPQQRLLLEVTWEALEDAGLPPRATAGARVGAYIGGLAVDAPALQLPGANRDLGSAATTTGMSMTMLSARLAYTFDWRGPCLTLDTAGSSSLVALHHACVALIHGECELAVAGGVNVLVNPATTLLMANGHYLSPDARCRPFDHRADGYARGEGAGVVLLKPVAAALRDGDHIRALVRGTAVNQNGRTPGRTAGSAEAQREVIRQACRSGNVDPGSLGYVEAHGAGMPDGDTVEAAAVGEVLAGSGRTHWIGSVTSNIGHTEAAAGVAGVIKASLCLQRGLIPPNLHFERPNPDIPFDRLRLRVPTELVAFPETTGPRRAGVNSFGFGGTNAHAVLEQAPEVPDAPPAADDGRAYLLPLSARSPGALRALADAYADMLESPGAPALDRVCRAAARQREHHPLRTFVVAKGTKRAAAKLRELDLVSVHPAAPGTVAFVYTGMGPQWWGMGRQLLRDEPCFARAVAACDEVLARFGLCLTDELSRSAATSRLAGTLHAQVANVVVQVGLTEVWRSWGIEPAAAVGHSVGELAAAYATGVLPLDEVLTVSYHCARLQGQLAGRGAMAAVDLPVESARRYLLDGVAVAAVNRTTATTLAGDRDAVDAVVRRLRADGAAVRPLRVEVAYHSHHMDEIRQPLHAELAGIRPRAADTPLFSTVTGDRVDGTGMDAGYWWRNVRQPVQFAAALHRLLDLKPAIVLQVGPHPVLAPAIREALAERGSDAVSLASLRRDRPQRQQLLASLGAMYAAGAEPDWARVYPGPREHLALPRYPWQRERHSTASAPSTVDRPGTGGLRLAGRPVVAATPTRDIRLSAAEFPYLAAHRTFPGAGYLEAALALFPDEQPCFLEDVAFHRPLVLAEHAVATLRAGYDPVQRLVTLHSRGPGDSPPWTLHARLRHPDLANPRLPRPRVESLAALTRWLPEVNCDGLSAQLDRLWVNEQTAEVFAELRVDTVDGRGYRLHPALLDAALQAMIAGAQRVRGHEAGTYRPEGIAELRYFRAPGQQLWLHGQGRRGPAADRLECELTLVTDEGAVVAEVIGLRAQLLTPPDPTPAVTPQDLYYAHVWRAEPAVDGTGGAAGAWVVAGTARSCADLVLGLTDGGGNVHFVASAGRDWWQHVVTRLAAEAVCRGIVYVHHPVPDGPACAPAAAALRLVQALGDAPVPLFLITAGAQSVTDEDPTTDPSAASLWGLARVVTAERPGLRCRLIDIEPDSLGTEQTVAGLVAELTGTSLEEVALRGGTRYVRRLERAGHRSALHHASTRTDATPVRLTTTGRSLDGLHFAATTRRAPGPTEVEIEVAYAGLGFIDLVKVTGPLRPEAMEGSYSQQALGLECSGRVVRVGLDVTGLRPGDEVFVHGRDLFGSYVTVDALRVVRKPAALSLAQAASLLPVVTAYTALVRLARAGRRERVLVHSAAGGVGLAAVRVATWLGATVYATAGTEERRQFLTHEGVIGVSDSRSTSFADDILQWTDGTGVDVVVNSLPGEMRHRSLDLLAPFGRFVELRPADAAGDWPLRLAPFRRALSFHAFDYDQLMLREPRQVRSHMTDVVELYDKAAFAPLPVLEAPAGAVERAFRTMTSRDYIGKIVVRMAGEAVTVPASSIQDTPVGPGATYVISGGLGGPGLAVAGWMAEHRASHLVLLDRPGAATPEAEQAVAALRERDVQVRVAAADLTDAAALAQVFTRLRAELPPLRGIVHAAA
ncbi:MAG TPA: beta-ketoacyl synthase N-terminal-like domain-containing protein, partial [Rugosimonospora sp.]|nr:beta-ketoacyl synthase N-terminal-like domain-containing protein [Rugosimonospora sp.]